MKKLAIIRPGAIGDIICIFHLSEELYKRYGFFDIYCADGYYNLLKEFVDSNSFKFELKPLKSLVKINYEIVHSLIGYPVDKGYPSVEMPKHLVLLMAEELGLHNLKSVPILEIDSPTPPKNITHSDFVTVQVATGWSRYKELSIEQNENLCKIIKSEFPFKIIQIGAKNEIALKNADIHLLGEPFETSVGALAWAKYHVGPDSVFNHISNFSWLHKRKQTKALIYFGSTSPSGSGYSTNENLFLKLPCQPCYRENPEISSKSGGPCPYGGMCLKQMPGDFVHSFLRKTFENI